jgi:hypothetical protein
VSCKLKPLSGRWPSLVHPYQGRRRVETPMVPSV